MRHDGHVVREHHVPPHHRPVRLVSPASVRCVHLYIHMAAQALSSLKVVELYVSAALPLSGKYGGLQLGVTVLLLEGAVTHAGFFR